MYLHHSWIVMQSITVTNLAGLDMNLFVVLHAVLEERSATRAAKRLNVTQSAVSNALARLRAALGDSLVVRSGRGLVATPRAELLAPVIAHAIRELEKAIDVGKAFAPEESTRTFTLAAADNHQAREVPRLAALFRKKLPRAQLRIVSADFLAATDGLATGEVDIAFVPANLLGPDSLGMKLWDERATFVVRRGHPKVRGKLNAKLFNQLSHIDVEVVLGKKGVGHRLADQHWKAAGLTRDVSITVPYFMTAAIVASQTDCMAGLPSHIAEVALKMLPLQAVKTSFPLPTMTMAMTWHERTNADAGATFFRDLIVAAVRD